MGHGSLASSSEFKYEDPRFFVPPNQLLCRLIRAWPAFVCTARTEISAHVKDPIFICRKSVDLTAGGMETRKHCIQEGEKAG